MSKWIAVLFLALLVAGCGGGDERADGAVKFAGQMRATGVAPTMQSAAPTVTAEMTLDWAEYSFPDLFPKATGMHFPSVDYQGVVYAARAYSGPWGTRYLGITPDGRIFGLGDFTGETLQQFNDISHWAAQVLADQCNVNPDSCLNSLPVADAGPLQNVTTGTLVTLNGSASSDANGDSLTFAWTLTSKPAGSAASLAGATSAAPTFTADVAGAYVASLVVNDGKVNSTGSTVTVTATVANAAPVANAGTAQTVTVGSTVTLNGAASSDANGDYLWFQWTLTAKPSGSTATLSNAASIAPSFIPDLVGTYVATLRVNDGRLTSTSSNVTITVISGGSATIHLYLFGGSNYLDYLGCLTCSTYDSESVCNPYGAYGSEYRTTSIWNEYGTYGSPYRTYSPWNQYSSSGPAIIGSDGNFYGYFTANEYRSQRTTISWAVRTLNFYVATKSIPATRTFLCGT